MYCYTEETNLFVLLYPVVSNRKEHIKRNIVYELDL